MKPELRNCILPEACHGILALPFHVFRILQLSRDVAGGNPRDQLLFSSGASEFWQIVCFHGPSSCVEGHILEKKKKREKNTELNTLKERERSRRGIFSDIFLSQNLPGRNTKGISRKDIQRIWKHLMEGGEKSS